MCARLQTVVETPAYLSAAKGLLSDSKRGEVVNMVAENPKMGVSLGGGIRKMRIARLGRGKSSGARVVFLFSGEDIPVFFAHRLCQERESESQQRRTRSTDRRRKRND